MFGWPAQSWGRRPVDLPMPAPKPTLREIASTAPTHQLIAVLADELCLRSDADPQLLHHFANLLGRHADEIERSRT